MKIYFALFIIGSGSKYFYVDQNEVYSKEKSRSVNVGKTMKVSNDFGRGAVH